MVLGSIKYSYKRPIAEQYPIYTNRVIYYGAGSPYLGTIFCYI